MTTFRMFAAASLALLLLSSTAPAQDSAGTDCASLGEKLNQERATDSHSTGSVTTRFSAKTNRCYVALERHSRDAVPGSPTYKATLFLLDGRTHQQLAFTRSDGANKLGMVFDPKHTEKIGDDKGFADAADYIRQKMADE